MISARIFVTACLAAGLAACSSHHGPPPPTFSPTGEPLVPPQWPLACADALGMWFDRLDTAHSGRVTLAQLQADGEKQYRLMDLRHDGKVTAEELSKYRLAHMGGHNLSLSTPGQRNAIAGRDPDETAEGNDLERAFDDPNRHRKDTDHRPTDAFAALISDQPDPVMTADTDLDGSVTIEEFRALIAQDFADYDKPHAGFITRDEVQAGCPKAD